jgi:glycosyltransferase involved in cell wall biosynthesis
VRDLKISIITVCYNAGGTIERCIESVLAQNHKNIEYIIIDGGSTDGTLQIIDQYKQYIDFFVSEPDNGIYDAMNKGIKLAKGDIVGTLNADDVFADAEVLKSIVSIFEQNEPGIVYGDLDYINPNGETVRKWKSGRYKSSAFNWGWMPPHPSFYCKKELFDRFGLYDVTYGTAGDYELMLRFMYLNKMDTVYLNKVIVRMNIGGVSNRTFANRLKAWSFDFKAMRKNGVVFPHLAIVFKPLRKIIQFV